MNYAPIEHTVLVPVDAITVVNPRLRNKKVFDEITANIAELGLKRPITVAARETEGGDKLDVSRFDAAPLIAFIAAKETNYGTETNRRIPC